MNAFDHTSVTLPERIDANWIEANTRPLFVGHERWAAFRRMDYAIVVGERTEIGLTRQDHFNASGAKGGRRAATPFQTWSVYGIRDPFSRLDDALDALNRLRAAERRA